MIIKNRKGQEEMVGFVLIMVIIAIIFLIILGLAARKDGGKSSLESINVNQFLESSMEYTTDCAVSYEPDYDSLNALLERCHSSSFNSCLNGKSVCSSLNETLASILDLSWNIKEGSVYKGYIFNATYSGRNASIAENVISLYKGNCSFSRIGGDYIIPSSPGVITASLEICL